jgi:uncharacterized membrane protein (UPF0127 family)
MCLLHLIYLLLKDKYKTKKIKFKNKTLKVLVADSFLKRAIGLMYRKDLKEEGMLFIFKKEARHAITMKNMNFNVDIFWLDEKGKIKEMLKSTPSLAFYNPKCKSKYILELKSNIINAKTGESFNLCEL